MIAPLWRTQPWFLVLLEMLEDYPRIQPNTPNSTPNPSKDHHELSSYSSYMAYLQNSFMSRSLSQSASQLLLLSWRMKTTSNYNSLFNKWASECEQEVTNFVDGTVEDVVNFLAKLHEKGYQYCSLHSYRSANSSVYKHVEGTPIVQHPLVSRALKAALMSILHNKSTLHSGMWVRLFASVSSDQIMALPFNS